jgi:protocatechuate 3,4-dioxygenase, beta subunit
MTAPAFHIPMNRRILLRSLLATTGGIITSGIYAEALSLTPRSTEGPYYPDHLPLDQDNDLIQIQGDATGSAGEITNLGGRVLGVDGKPITDALVEIWQADANGCYIHSRGQPPSRVRDAHFQGYGKTIVNAQGEYKFRTIKPGLYTGRTIHWHVRVQQGNKSMLTTQLFVAGVPQNDQDGLLRRMGTEQQRLSVIREFKPQSPASKELFGTWDIIIGHTPEEPEQNPSGRPAKGGPRNGRNPTNG